MGNYVFSEIPKQFKAIFGINDGITFSAFEKDILLDYYKIKLFEQDYNSAERKKIEFIAYEDDNQIHDFIEKLVKAKGNGNEKLVFLFEGDQALNDFNQNSKFKESRKILPYKKRELGRSF